MERLRVKLGCEGIGIYWSLVEMLYEQGGSLFLSECETYAKAMNTSLKSLLSTINDFKLFHKNATSFYSTAVNKRLRNINTKRELARISAECRWNANALRTHSEGNAMKGKEIIKNKSNFFAPPVHNPKKQLTTHEKKILEENEK